jgi:hypothetical protein
VYRGAKYSEDVDCRRLIMPLVQHSLHQLQYVLAKVARLVLDAIVAPSLLLITHVCVVQSQEEGDKGLSGGRAGLLEKSNMTGRRLLLAMSLVNWNC